MHTVVKYPVPWPDFDSMHLILVTFCEQLFVHSSHSLPLYKSKITEISCIYYVSVTDDNCTVTPLNPTFLTATGGRLYDGMTNVKMNCKCVNQYPEDNMWYYPNGTSLPLQLSSSLDSPQIMQENGTLTIPKFTQLYEGTYYCGANDSLFDHHTTLELLRGK